MDAEKLSENTAQRKGIAAMREEIAALKRKREGGDGEGLAKRKHRSVRRSTRPRTEREYAHEIEGVL